MSLEPQPPNIPANGGNEPDKATERAVRRRRYVGRHRRPRSVPPWVRRLWPTALRVGLLLIVLATGMPALNGPVGFGAQVALIVLEVCFREG